MKKKKYSFHNNRHILRRGIRDGIPIALGYFAVSFSLGIAAKRAGLTPLQSFIASALCNASAGEYAGFTVIAAQAAFYEAAIITLITNARYLLMSTAMSQRMEPTLPLPHRLIMGHYITDELFGIAIAQEGYLNPYYTYGAVLVAAPAWAAGTMLGAIAGAILPLRVVSALSVALYGMFLAIIIPPSRRSGIIAGLVAVSFAASFGASVFLPCISEGMRTIILTVAISAAAALLFPVKEEAAS